MANTRPTVVIVGESPPPKASKGFVPFDCESGKRLAEKAMGLTGKDPLLAHVPRVNIFDEPGVGVTPGKPWSQVAAEEAAGRIAGDYINTTTTLIMMGGKVKAAFGYKDMPAYSWVQVKYLALHFVACPHPSGQNTSLNIASVQATARRLLIPELVAGCRGLRSWNWRLAEGLVLADLGAALCPTDPALGCAAAVVTAEMSRRVTDDPERDAEVRRVACGIDLLTLMQACVEGPESVLDLWQVEKRQRGDLRSRVRAVKNSGVVANYPPEVLRATMGRYVALGVL